MKEKKSVCKRERVGNSKWERERESLKVIFQDLRIMQNSAFFMSSISFLFVARKKKNSFSVVWMPSQEDFSQHIHFQEWKQGNIKPRVHDMRYTERVTKGHKTIDLSQVFQHNGSEEAHLAGFEANALQWLLVLYFNCLPIR